MSNKAIALDNPLGLRLHGITFPDEANAHVTFNLRTRSPDEEETVTPISVTVPLSKTEGQLNYSYMVASGANKVMISLNKIMGFLNEEYMAPQRP